MPEKISFSQFQHMLSAIEVQWETVSQYIELDPNIRIPKLRIRPGVISDYIPHDYDIDKAIYAKLNEENKMRAAKRRVDPLWADRIRVVAEGDSWFYYPNWWKYSIESIAEQLAEDEPFKDRLNVLNIAWGGDTLAKILRNRQSIFDDLRDHQASFFLFSAGGNDFIDGISENIREYDASLPLDQYLTDEGKCTLRKIGLGYEELLRDVTRQFPDMQTICYGYDYPRPDKDGAYIGQVLYAKGIPESDMIPIMAHMIDQLKDVIQTVTSNFKNVKYLDCRRIAHPIVPWKDDMHPTTEGFTELAKKFADNVI